MKWYSVKKYIPQTGTELLLRAVHIEQEKYERYFMASLEVSEDLSLLANWHISNGAYHDINLHHYLVTHFCILDPVEI